MSEEQQQQAQLKPGDKVAPGKVVGKDGKTIEESSSKKLLRAGKNVGEAYIEFKTGGGLGKGGVGKPGGPGVGQAGGPGVPNAGGPSIGQAGGQGLGNAGGPGVGQPGGQGLGNAGNPGLDKTAGNLPENPASGPKADMGLSGNQPGMQQPKGYGSGNQNALNNNPTGGQQQMNPKQTIGKVANEVGDKISDKIDENPVAKKVADDLEDVSDTVNNGMDAYKKAKSGDLKGAKESAKKAKKSAGKAVRKLAKRAILGILAALLLPLLCIILTFVILLLPFIAGYKVLADFIGSDEYDDISSQYGFSDTAAEAQTESQTTEAIKAVVGDIPDFDVLSDARKRLLTAAVEASGMPYTEGGLPSSGEFSELSAGLSGLGLYRWLIWNVFGSDFPITTVADMVWDNDAGDGYLYVDLAYKQPGDAAVDENGDIAIYLGNENWLHASLNATDGTEDVSAKKTGTFVIGYYEPVLYVERYVKLDEE